MILLWNRTKAYNEWRRQITKRCTKIFSNILGYEAFSLRYGKQSGKRLINMRGVMVHFLSYCGLNSSLSANSTIKFRLLSSLSPPSDVVENSVLRRDILGDTIYLNACTLKTINDSTPKEEGFELKKIWTSNSHNYKSTTPILVIFIHRPKL